MPKKTIILDSTQIADFLLCPRIWHYKHAMKLTSHNTTRVNVPLQQGSLGHKYLERYYSFTADGERPSAAMKEAIEGFNIEKESDGEIQLEIEDVDVVKKALWNYFMCYQAQGDFSIRSSKQVELGFSEVIFEDEDKLFILEGKIDILKPEIQGNQLGYIDHKFQTRKHDIYRRSVQFKNYALVTNASMAMVNYIRLTKKFDETTLERKLLTFGSIDHQAWRARLIGVFNRVLAKVEVGYIDPTFWQTLGSEPNWAMCQGQHGYECEFTGVCEETSASSALIVLESNFVKKKEWKPW